VDLGIKGRTAIVCAASSGLGRACAKALAGEGVNVVINARGWRKRPLKFARMRQRFK
jgi:3-oxoacyl-[acyl-carrier protein] reductase